MLRLLLVCVCAMMWCGALPLRAEGTEWFVAPGGTGTGTSASPFGRIQSGINAAQPGDTVTVAAGTYVEALQTVRNGTAGATIRVRSAGTRGSVVVTVRGRVLTIAHPYFTVEGLVFDGQYGTNDTVKVNSTGSYLVLRNVEVRRSTYDLVDMAAPQGVLVENSLIHHALNAANGRTDAHGIVAGAVQNLVIRNTEIHTFSGDGVQVDPGRAAPGWTSVMLEGDRIWLAPLTAAENGFAAGTVAGENAVDTKAGGSLPRSALVIRDTVAYGFRNGLLGNMAAFNLKENVDVTVDRATVYDSEIAFRTRGPGANGGAWVTVKNAVVYNVATAIRYEDNIERLRVWNTTIGRNVTRAFQAASSSAAGLDVRNVLFLGTTRPAEALDASNLAVGSGAFVNAAADNYSLASNSLAIDTGVAIADVTTDRVGVLRPQGRSYDVGAYEFTPAIAAETSIHAWRAQVVSGLWRVVNDATAVDGLKLSHPDAGAPILWTPLAVPANYFEVLASVQAGIPYRIWARGKADQSSRANDSVYMQFSTSTYSNGTPRWRIGTTSAAAVELADCNTCTPKEWGWQDNGEAATPGFLGPLIYFATTGWQTIRVQTREDGLSIDQIVLSPSLYLNTAPGTATNDTTILPES